MLVSVIIPTYNRKEYICQAVDSILSQTYKFYEVIVVDDGSTDGTGDLLHKRYGKRIKYFYQSNQGEAAARNYAISQSSGQYIALLDSDDVWLPTKLAQQAQFFENHPNTGLVSCHALAINALGEQIKQTPIYSDLAPEIIPLDQLLLNSPLYCSTVMIRKDCLDNVGLFHEEIRYGEDRDLFLRVAAQYPVGFINEALVKLRSHQNAQSRLIIPPQEIERRVSDRLSIIARVFPLLSGDREELAELKDRALAKEYVRAAIYDYMQGDVERGAKRLLKTIALDVNTWGSGAEFAKMIGDYAMALAAKRSSAEAVRFIDTTFANLPKELEERFMSLRHKVLGRVHAESAFMYYQQGNFNCVPSHVWRAYLHDLGWIRNLGLLSIGTRSYTNLNPKQLFAYMTTLLFGLAAVIFYIRLICSKPEKFKQ